MVEGLRDGPPPRRRPCRRRCHHPSIAAALRASTFLEGRPTEVPPKRAARPARRWPCFVLVQHEHAVARCSRTHWSPWPLYQQSRKYDVRVIPPPSPFGSGCLYKHSTYHFSIPNVSTVRLTLSSLPGKDQLTFADAAAWRCGVRSSEDGAVAGCSLPAPHVCTHARSTPAASLGRCREEATAQRMAPLRVEADSQRPMSAEACRWFLQICRPVRAVQVEGPSGWQPTAAGVGRRWWDGSVLWRCEPWC